MNQNLPYQPVTRDHLEPSGLKAHTHAEREAMIAELIPLWQKKFGDNLLGIGACASFARGEDTDYSDLELNLFVKELPDDEERYYQRVVDGMLIEVIYMTPQDFLLERKKIASHWHISASDRMVGVYHADFIEHLVEQAEDVKFSEVEFLEAAARKRYELQENCGKVLNAVVQKNREGISLLLMDAMIKVMEVLALINQTPFVTFSRYISQARKFKIKPKGFDRYLDILVDGSYQNLDLVGDVTLSVFCDMEKIFTEHGIHLYEDDFDPNLPNQPVERKEGVRLVAVNGKNFRACVKLPTGPDHKHVAPNVYSIAEGQFWSGSHSCCIYHDENMVGYTLFGTDYDHQKGLFLMWIVRLMIAEEERGKGYGRTVLQVIVDEAGQLGCDEVRLSTEPDNHKAIHLYESMGFFATQMEDDEMVYVFPLKQGK